MRIEEWAYVRSGIHVAKPSVFVSYRQRGRVPGVLFLAYIGDLVAANAVCPELDEAVNRSPLGAVLIWVPFALCAAASLVMAFRYVIRIGSAERLLDASCDPTALAARGDELGLGIRMPRCGYTRVEAVLMQRWAVALVEVGRLADAAVARRRLGESLACRPDSEGSLLSAAASRPRMRPESKPPRVFGAFRGGLLSPGIVPMTRSWCFSAR